MIGQTLIDMRGRKPAWKGIEMNILYLELCNRRNIYYDKVWRLSGGDTPSNRSIFLGIFWEY